MSELEESIADLWATGVSPEGHPTRFLRAELDRRGVVTAAGLVDKKGKWSGGKTHLVQVGDLPDRGPDTLEIIDRQADEGDQQGAGAVKYLLIYDLESYGDKNKLIKRLDGMTGEEVISNVKWWQPRIRQQQQQKSGDKEESTGTTTTS